MVNRTEVQLGDHLPIVGISNIELPVEDRCVRKEQRVITGLNIDWKVVDDRRDVFWNDENAVDLVGQLAQDSLDVDSAPLELCFAVCTGLFGEVFWFDVVLQGLNG